MLEAAIRGTVPSEGPTNKIFKPGNEQYVNTMELKQEELNQLLGGLSMKLESLRHQHWVLMGGAEYDQADTVDSEINRYRLLINEIGEQDQEEQTIQKTQQKKLQG